MSRLLRNASAVALLGVAALGSGCAQNALFELYVEVPPPVAIGTGTVEARFARVFMLPGSVSSDQLWDGPRSRIVPLTASAQRIGLTVTRGIAAERDPISVRVAYCAAESDCESGDPTDWLGHEDFVFDRVFYTARVTCFSLPLSDTNLTDGLTLETDTTVIGACEVGGCVDAPLDTTVFCGEPGRPDTHFCALGRNGGFCDDLHDDLADQLAAP